MSEDLAREILDLVTGREGHFRLESGHHAGLWLDLDTLFLDPHRVRPLVGAMVRALRTHRPDAVCGPLVGGAFVARALSSSMGIGFLFTERVLPAERAGMYAAAYRLPAGLAGRVAGKRVAVVDDVISAGSAVRGTCAELRAHGAEVVVVGALLRMGQQAKGLFDAEGVPMVAVAERAYDVWPPSQCPLCAAGRPLEDVAVGGDAWVR